jgi:ABC-type polysaccharide/polyol phosphate transport system ATPase subunit
MSTVESLCDRVLVLDSGRMQFLGSPKDAIAFYLRDILAVAS